MALFEIRNLTFTYPGQEKPALTDLSFSLEQGEFLVVCGKSGCGKSTLLRHFKTAMSPYGERKGQILLKAGSWIRSRCGNRGHASAMCSRVPTISC